MFRKIHMSSFQLPTCATPLACLMAAQAMLDEESQTAKDNAAQQKDRNVKFEGGQPAASK